MTTKRLPNASRICLLITGICLFWMVSCEDHRILNPVTLTTTPGPPLASGLRAPIGLANDPKGNLWITEAGSGTVNNGQVSVITPAGKTVAAITGFRSAISPENSPEGLNHLLYRDGKLYILHGVEEKLYIVDVSSFVPGVSTPIPASSLTGIDIGTFVRNAHPNAPDPDDSNPYNLAFGPNGDLFIVDAGANALIRRDKTTGALSVYAVFPDILNPTYPSAPQGPPTVDAVPSGIVYDGANFYVTTLTGFPFPVGKASIYQVSGTGTAPVTPTLYKTGFSGLTDIALSPGGKPVVTEFGFSTAGRIADGTNSGATLFTPAITPVDIQPGIVADTYYVLYYGPGIVVKLTATN